MTSDVLRRLSFQRAVLQGLTRVARVSDASRNRATLLGLDQDGPLAGADAVMAELEQRLPTMQLRNHRIHVPGGRAAVSFGNTRNNLREFAFFESVLNDHGSRLTHLNVHEQPYRKIRGDATGPVLDDTLDVIDAFLRRRTAVSPALGQEVLLYARSILAASSFFRRVHPAIFLVANDHSPSPVAYAAVARHAGVPVVYLQHAEISPIFPPLAFSLSVLRNQRSLDLYQALGHIQGRVAVAKRMPGWIAEPTLRGMQEKLRRSAVADIVIYPSALFNHERLRSIVAGLLNNDHVQSVRLKLHPNSKSQLSDALPSGFEAISETPSEPHVAVCGNSSIITELVSAGHVAFQDFMLDDVAADYYGFVRDGLSAELPAAFGAQRFWHEAAVLPQNAWERIPQLAVEENFCHARQFWGMVEELLGR